MKKLVLKISFLFIIAIVFANSASAWDDTGHKLIAYIAWQKMSPAARAKAVKLLLNAPEDSDLSVFYPQDSRSAEAKGRELFMIASTWADIIRNKNFAARYAKYHHGNWHYLDTFWREADGKIELVTDLESNPENAIERLYAFDKVLRDASASDEDKAIALAWILHLIGDIHQPLHDSARVTENNPQGDQGGNLFILSAKDAKESINLHWYWDSIIGRNIPRVSDACDSSYIPAIADKIMEKYPSSKMQNRFSSGNFSKWQQEGFQIASTKLYPASLKLNEMPSESYQKQAFEIAQERIALAGYRLANLLNQIFDTQESSKESNEKAASKIESKADTLESHVGQGAQDKWIWTKTRAALAAIESLKDAAINVDVENSVVTLRGTVADKKQMQKAVKAVNEIEGVKAVKNLLVISR